VSKRGRKRAPFELTILVVAILACAAVVGGLLYAKITEPSGPPALTATVARAGEQPPGAVAYTVTVRNDGGETAESVVVSVSIGNEQRELELTSIARADEEEATVLFPPGTTGEAQAEVESYKTTRRD
jgi:uncharacterized protein (TIGR02588 family)